MDKLLLVPDAAAILRVSQEHVRLLIRRKKLKAYKEGNRGGYRITRQAVDEYIKIKLKQ